MKFLSFISVFTLLFLTACGPSAEETAAIEEEEQIIEAEDRELEQEIPSPEEYDQEEDEKKNGHEPIENPFEKLAGTYLALSTAKGGDPIIYHYCEAEDPAVVIDEEGGKKRFIIALGQDSEVLEISSIVGETYEMELYQVSDYTITLINTNSKETVTVTALVNEDTGTSFFEGLDLLHAMYLREDHVDDVEHVSENCDYLDDY